jgi:NDP-sugar pyrophosphorylase family protein
MLDRSLIFADVNIPKRLRTWFPKGKELWYILDHIEEAIWAIVNRHPGDYYELKKNVFIKGAPRRLDPCVQIYGPALIGADCEIRHGAFLRENVIIGDHCVVGNSTEIKNAVLFNHVQVPHFNYVGDSVMGYKSHLGAGVKLSNVRLDEGPIFIKYPGAKPIATGRVKFGAIIGDHAQIGCNSVLNPGTVVEKGAFIFPLQCVGGYYGKGERK